VIDSLADLTRSVTTGWTVVDLSTSFLSDGAPYIAAELVTLEEQGVALTGRNKTGPLYSRGAIIRLEAAWVLQTTPTDDDRHYRRLLFTIVWHPYTMCRRASNKAG